MTESLRVLWEDGERAFCRGSRFGVDGSRNTVLVALLTAEHPLPFTLDRLAHEYGLKDELESAWAARPLELLREHGRTKLVLEDPGGEPLARLIGAPMEVGLFLGLAIGIAGALGQAHRRGLVHKDLKPAHILVDCADGGVRLTGFGIASRLPRERQALEPPETIAGTLAYMAPEQTGRMNRSIDSRSDLYSLGVTLYQMLTGSLPFAASDPMEWVHCHIARRPTPPEGRFETVPAPVSRIIMKLLAKAAEERYQTAAGLESDLKRCLAGWEAKQRIDDFPLGNHDAPDRLLIPERLYGREREVEILLAAFDRAAKGEKPELVLVSGYSGIGKSTLVHELHKVLVPRGLFTSGKFDQYKRDIPYSALAQAFQGLIRSLLDKSDAELMKWRGAFLEALEPNGRLMVDLVSELKLIIGDQPPVPELEPQQAQSRLQLVFRRFIGVFARHDRPLALFLDDLQWLDAAALDLIEDLLIRSELRHLMLIGAYRANEVNAAHPLMRKVETLKSAGAGIKEIALAPLARDELGRLIADALRCKPPHAAPLAELVYEKTGGNPFFVIQFLYALAEEGLLRFDHGTMHWSWDLDRIHAKGYTDNVVDLMVGKLTRLPAETQDALRQLACLGNVAEIEMLSMVLDLSEDEVQAILWPAVRQELIERMDGAYRFSHDRVQEAAYSLIRAEARAEAHLLIGRLLAVRTPPEKREEAIFEIVLHLNRGAALILEQDERDQLAEFNLIAGKRAKASSANASALAYLNAGVAQLAEDSWQRQRELIFALELNRAECEYLLGELRSAEELLAMLSTRAQTTTDSAAVTCMRINLYTTLDRSDRAVEVGLDHLRRVDGQWPLHPTADAVRQDYDRLWRQLRSGSIEALLDLPPMRNPDRCATMDVLTVLTSPALFTDLNLFRLVVSRMATLSLDHGNDDGSCLAYVWLGGVLGTYFGEYETGFCLGRLGLELVERQGLDRFRARVYLVFAVHVAHWTQSLQTSRAFLSRAFEAARDAGDLSYATYSCIDLITNRFAAGDSLSEVEREAEHGFEFARKVRFGLASDCITGQLRLIRMLRGLTLDFTSFNDAEFDEGRFEHHLQNNPQLAIGSCWYWIRKLQASIYASDEASAIAALAKAAPLLWTTPTQFELAEYHFYGALARAAHCDLTEADERSQHLEALADHHKQLAVWAQNCPATFANRSALVGAEIARLEGREMDALRLYEEAIRLARAHGFIQNEGLAHERAARFCMARGFQTIAGAYLRNARHCYLSWGADGKVWQLEEMYPQLRTEEPAPAPTSTIATSVERLDLATVIKVSQAVSGEIVLEKLIDTLMRTALEQAGAERGLLILSWAGEPRIAAEAVTGDTMVVHLHDRPVTAAAMPETILHYVLRAYDGVILDDAATQSSFAADPYIREREARSILCMPLINQGKLVGVLYLENNLTPSAFAPARIAVLKMLASQAAITLENARLYRDLEQREAKIRGLVDANIIGIFIWDFEGRIFEANDAFLHIVGYDRQDLVSGRLRWTALTPPEWGETDALLVQQQKITGSLQPFEKEYFRKDGSRVPVLIGTATFERGDQGVAFVIDLTERKRTEEALRRSEAYLAEAQRMSRTGSWARNANGETTHSSEEHKRLYGFDPELGVPTHEAFMERIHSEDRATVNETIGRAVAKGTDYETDFRTTLSDGTIKYIRAVGHPVFDGAGELVEYIGTAVDVTERKRAEQALRERETKIRRLVDANIIGICIGDREGRIVEANDAFLGMLGYDRYDLATHRIQLTELTPPEWLERSEQALSELNLTNAAQPFEKEYFRKDGSRVSVLIGLAGIEQDTSQNIAFVLDLTERKRAEAEARESEQRYREVQTELAHANRVATMGQLTGSIAHEVNQPITAAVTNANAALRWLNGERADLGEVRQALGRIVENGNRAGEVISRIRALIQKAPPRKNALGINDAILEVVALTNGEVMKNGVSVRTQLAEELPAIAGDRVQLQQVILNLIVNAIEAMSGPNEAHRDLLISTEKAEPDSVRVTVRDSGPGLAPEALERLFDSFYTTKANGMGLGLSICRSIVEAHGGGMWVSANEPRGAVFQFTVPAGPAGS
jgi:PAS domain S-box-containing protein